MEEQTYPPDTEQVSQDNQSTSPEIAELIPDPDISKLEEAREKVQNEMAKENRAQDCIGCLNPATIVDIETGEDYVEYDILLPTLVVETLRFEDEKLRGEKHQDLLDHYGSDNNPLNLLYEEVQVTYTNRSNWLIVLPRTDYYAEFDSKTLLGIPLHSMSSSTGRLKLSTRFVNVVKKSSYVGVLVSFIGLVALFTPQNGFVESVVVSLIISVILVFILAGSMMLAVDFYFSYQSNPLVIPIQ